MTLLDLLEGAGVAWAAWSGFNLLVACWLRRWALPPYAPAYVVGVLRPQIRLAWWLPRVLSQPEIDAIAAHEQGHLACGHLRRNALRAVLVPFWPRSEREAERQEAQADLWAARHGHGLALAAALRKLSTDPVDVRRAWVLELWVATEELLAPA